MGENDREHDVFISYASEDREPFVRRLAEDLRDHGVRVWYDEFALQFGDSLSTKISEGLAKSAFGLVVVSNTFLQKQWPQKELSTLLSLQVAGRSVILPVLHGLTFQQLQARNPLLADLLALDSSRGTGPILSATMKRILVSRNSQQPTVEAYHAVLHVVPSEKPEHYKESIWVNGIYRVSPGSDLVYRDVVTTSSPLGSLDYFNAVPSPTDGLDEQRTRSHGRFMHFELKGPPGANVMQISANLGLTKQMTKEDGYVAVRLPYQTRFVSMIFDYSGLMFDPECFCTHVDHHSSESQVAPVSPRLSQWPERRLAIVHAEGMGAGSNLMLGWGRWYTEWSKSAAA